jgi:hypothetical protein
MENKFSKKRQLIAHCCNQSQMLKYIINMAKVVNKKNVENKYCENKFSKKKLYNFFWVCRVSSSPVEQIEFMVNFMQFESLI